LVFVELKSGGEDGLGRPEERAGGAKRGHLVWAAGHYCQHHRVEGREFRFDVIGVVFSPGEPQLTHLPDAFQANSL